MCQGFHLINQSSYTAGRRIPAAISFLLLLLLTHTAAYGQPAATADLGKIATTIQLIPRFDIQKQQRIDQLKHQLAQLPGSDYRAQYDGCAALYEEYKVFKYDSAYHYARRLQESAGMLQAPDRIMMAKIKLCFTLLSSGMYKETYDSLSNIQAILLADSVRAEYYTLMGRYYYDLGDFDNDKYHTPYYNNLARRYLDSALSLLPASSYEHAYFSGLKELKAGNKPTALVILKALLERKDLTAHQIAVATSTLSDLYIQQRDNDKAIRLLTTAVIADIQSSTKETSAAFILASLLYKKGDVKNASLCINQAIADAVFYGARQRKVQVSAILPLIEAQKLSIVESQKRNLIFYAITVTFLLLLIIVSVVVILRQVKKLKAAQVLITTAHNNELRINTQLAEANERLQDANKIKEKYIGYFFNFNSEFYDKMDKLKKAMEQKIADRKLDELKTLVTRINLRKEKEELLRNFDQAFLKLFPNFVTVFNTLFKEEDQQQLKEGELLNVDLRIFALIRMGIHENEKIAHIMQYSVNTINTYKTKIKNKSIVPNEEFEKRVMEIKAV
ncbi:tetratricopeptide repeat protein [Chitinophaga pendula]|uniref:DUF6377 domain-containing protein n=1 Tax=Chitinophaga TaxID=79328 RepID=UPI0018E012B5|nr:MULTISPECIES: DUF6377 domain-containing protein [Chitinophaga]UCJ07370.1 tetratricopeptide repeat protein [Chitinophaga pendula]